MPHAGYQLPLDLTADFSRFREGHGDTLHFAAHSHHFWPDVTRDAQIRCWDDAANLSDSKWDHILSSLWSDVRARIAVHLSLPDPETLVPAPNTHELVGRILSCLPRGRPARILTSDSEFHSFTRQCARLAEEGLADVTAVPTQPFSSLTARLLEAGSARPSYDLVFISQVFFNSGFVLEELDRLVDALCRRDTLVVIDGYHGFLALPTDLSAVADRIFYLAGGYKYAMAGEGACFMHCPPGVATRPLNTGWFAGFGGLTDEQTGVAYDTGGWRFMGSTFDASGLYRLQASLRWLQDRQLDPQIIHGHARALQDMFIEGLERNRPGLVKPSELLLRPDQTATGNFLTFEDTNAGDVFQKLHKNGIITDHRADRLRVGFGLYHTALDVGRLLDRLQHLT